MDGNGLSLLHNSRHFECRGSRLNKAIDSYRKTPKYIRTFDAYQEPKNSRWWLGSRGINGWQMASPCFIILGILNVEDHD